MPDEDNQPQIPPELVEAIKRSDIRREIVARFMWLLGIALIAAGVGLRSGVDLALIVTGGLVWGEYFVGGVVELVTSRKGAK